jgi:hypothetical protein
MRAATRSTGSLDAGREPDGVGLVAPSVMPGTVDATYMVDARREHLEDEHAIENLPEPIPLTPEQLAAQAEAVSPAGSQRLTHPDVVLPSYAALLGTFVVYPLILAIRCYLHRPRGNSR